MVSTHHQELGWCPIFERGTVDHLDAIMRIEESSFSAPWTRRMFEVELTDNPFARLLTTHIGHADQSSNESRDLVGYVCFWVVFEELRMMNLAVSPRVRRRGVGRGLLHQALTMGRQEGARRALLEVRVSNHPAVALYEHAGFLRSGVRTNYYTNPVEDAVLMELEL